MVDAILRADAVSKSFSGVEVLSEVSIALMPGSVHGLVGENGAGKSTLMKIFAGVYRADRGSVWLDGKHIDFGHPLEAMKAGLATVFQEFNLLPDRTVAENIYLGREPQKFGFVNSKKMVADTGAVMAELGIDFISPSSRVSSLSVAEQQIVEIIKALSFDARVISMDEPTAALADHEVQLLQSVIARLKSRGVGILYVSHRLNEVFDICDAVSVLKDGKLVWDGLIEEITQPEMVRLMVGRPIDAFFPPVLEGTTIGETRLEIFEGGNEFVDSINLSVKSGEIVGIAGLQGAGRTEVVEAIFGAVPFSRGLIHIDGVETSIRNPRQAVKAGIALVTEDRKAQGLALEQSILDNALLTVRGAHPSRTRGARRDAPGVLSSLEVNSTNLGQEIQFLSGGNQQKVVLSKWLLTNPRIVILDEPTRGIDVGAKVAVYTLMRELALKGVAILMVSSELPEVIGMSDRIVVMREGRLQQGLGPQADEAQILTLATGTIALTAEGEKS